MQGAVPRTGRAVLGFILLYVLAAVAADAQLRYWGRRSDRDVASVHVAVQSVAPFEDYIAALQPTFKMTADDALSKAVAQTRTQSTETLSAFIAAFTASMLGGGVAAPADEKPLAAAAPDAVSRTITPTLPEGKPELDQIFLHTSATALMQYVAQLNTYVRDAAVATRTRPYLVRMQISVLPTTSTQGYDAYSTVSFFTESGEASQGRYLASRWASPGEIEKRQRKVGRDVADAQRELLNQKDALGNAKTEKEIAEGRKLVRQAEDKLKFVTDRYDLEMSDLQRVTEAQDIDCQNEMLQVIPLLVTDNFEASLHQDVFERLRNITVAAASSGARSRVAAGIRSQLDDASKTLMRNLNSLMTVTQVAENSIQVRMGAMYGNRTNAMVPRTYGVTLLVLFPTAERYLMDAPEDSVVSQILPCSVAAYSADTFFRSTRNGRIVRRGTEDDLMYAVRSIAPRYRWNELEEMVDAVRDRDYDAFSAVVGNEGQAMDMWARLVAAASTLSTSRGRFQAPFREIQFFDAKSKSSVLDNGTNSLLLLSGGANLLPDRIAGTLTVYLKADQGAPPPTPIYLNSSAVEVTTDGRMATLTFPSIHKLVKKDNVDKVMAQVRYGPGVRDWQTRRTDLESVWYPGVGTDKVEPVAYVGPLEEPKKEEKEKEKPKKAFTMTSTNNVVYARRHTGTVVVTLKHDEEKAQFPMYFAVEKGAQIAEVKPEVEAPDGNRNAVKNGEYKITLENLTAGSTVTLKSWRIEETDGKTQIPGDSITFEVRD